MEFEIELKRSVQRNGTGMKLHPIDFCKISLFFAKATALNL